MEAANAGLFLDSTSAEDAARLTALLEEHPAFSFLRLGDGELRFLLQAQGDEEESVRSDLRPSCEIAHGHPALTPKDRDRLLLSLEQCSLLDLYRDLPYNQENLPKLRWQRSPSLATASSGRLGLLFTWLHHEFRGYLARHRSVFCGAEASLLRELLTDPRFRDIAAPFWPENAAAVFVQPRNQGASISADLDDIKADLVAAIREHQADTVFISLGGAAKILCHELAQELGVRAIDFGSALRALTYSGSDGQSPWRASHHPFLIRVPLDLYIPALLRARPDLDSVTLLAKAHAQLCLEVQRKDPLYSNTSDANDFAMFDRRAENRSHFAEGMNYYRTHLLPLAARDPAAADLAREFRHWRRKRGLGWDGRLFQIGVTAKAALRRTLSALGFAVNPAL